MGTVFSIYSYFIVDRSEGVFSHEVILYLQFFALFVVIRVERFYFII